MSLLLRLLKRGSTQNRTSPIPSQIRANALENLYAAQLHDWNEKMAIQRAAIARVNRLSPEQVAATSTPFPGSTQNTINNYGSSGLIKGVLLTAAMVGAGSLGTVGLINSLGLLNKPSPVPVVPVREETPQETKINPGEYDIYLELKDNKIVPTDIKKVD